MQGVESARNGIKVQVVLAEFDYGGVWMKGDLFVNGVVLKDILRMGIQVKKQ